MASYGIYRGQVTNSQDPAMKGRLQVLVPAFGTAASGWALPCREYKSTAVPPPGSDVWVMFEGGDVSHPVWVGCAS